MARNQPPHAPTKISIQNITKIFGNDQQQKHALDLLDQGYSKEEILDQTGATVGVSQASFDIKEGEIFVIMGLSGSGKSTLVRMLNRLIEPTQGDILINGENVVDMDQGRLRQLRRKEISMVFQNFGLFPHKTILENAEYGLEVQGIDKDKRQQAAEKALDNAGLLAYKDQYPDQLSGGMQQRVGLARALANDPQIILMDEAFSALDPLIRRDMQDELLQLQEKDKRTIVFITHDLNESLRLGDRIAIMRDGLVVQVGTGEEILQQPENQYVERFVEDVDRARVYTAEHIMEAPHPLIIGRDGPRMALQKMEADRLQNMLVVDYDNVLLGYVRDGDVAQAVAKQQTQLEDLIIQNPPTVGPQTTMTDLYDIIQDAQTPVSVIDDKGRLMGIVIRNTVLTALAGDHRQFESKALEGSD